MTDSKDPDEGPFLALFEAAQTGDTSAQDALLRMYLPELQGYVRLHTNRALRARESTTDILQSTCREVLGHLDRCEFRGQARFRSWLYTITLNKIRQKGRHHFAEKRRPDMEEGGVDLSRLADVYGKVASPSGAAIHSEQVERLEAAFDQMRPEWREVITLSRLVGMSMDEVANQMGRSKDATRSLLGRALVELSKLLGTD